MLATALVSSRSTFGPSRGRARGVVLTARRRSRVVRVAPPPRLAPARAEETDGDTTRGDLDERAEAIIEEVERGGGDPTELLRRDVGRDVDTPEPARDSPRDTFAERVRRRGRGNFRVHATLRRRQVFARGGVRDVVRDLSLIHI